MMALQNTRRLHTLDFVASAVAVVVARRGEAEARRGQILFQVLMIYGCKTLFSLFLSSARRFSFHQNILFGEARRFVDEI